MCVSANGSVGISIANISNVTVFGDKGLKEIMKLKYAIRVSCNPIRLMFFYKEEILDIDKYRGRLCEAMRKRWPIASEEITLKPLS